MRVGPTLVVVGALATIPAMFLPLFEYGDGEGGGSVNTWELWNGSDVGLAAICGLAACLGLFALLTLRRSIRQLTAVAGAATFGAAFFLVPGGIDDSSNVGAGLWVVGATGAVALIGAVVIALTTPD